MFLKFAILLTALVVILCGSNSESATIERTPNTPPVVRIIKPQTGLDVKGNTLVPFEIEVSDQEDGASEYDEINGNEVILQVNYFTDTSLVAVHLDQQLEKMPVGLGGIIRANCLSCHRPHSRLIGPTFAEIAEQYGGQAGSSEYLQAKIIAGSKGVWGEVEMPPNPEISEDQAQEMAEWILNECSEDDVEYYVGLSGAFRTQKKTPDASAGFYVLRALYKDHGGEEEMGDELMGEDVVVFEVE